MEVIERKKKDRNHFEMGKNRNAGSLLSTPVWRTIFSAANIEIRTDNTGENL